MTQFLVNTKRQARLLLLATLAGLPLANANAEANTIEEILVSADFRDVKVTDLPTSITVIDQKAIEARGAFHLEQLLNVAPNVNFSSGASRGRFFLIRGIGERSQFVDPVNPSVGLIIDGIDFTGLGLAANTLDVKQVEILRGPQGTIHGANALAGLVNIKTNDPTDEFTGRFGAELAEFGGQAVSGVLSGPLTENLGYRLAIQQQQSDGFTENVFLNRDDTSDIDEQVVRAKLQYQANEQLELDFTGFYLNADNGYDDFSLTNNRVTGSDQPGEDTQESFAGAITLKLLGYERFDLQALVSAIDSDSIYSFDEDWSFVDEFDASLFPYSSADSFSRDRSNVSVDVRLLSKPGYEVFNQTTSWVAGIYYRSEQEDLVRERSADLAFDGQFTNNFDTENYAVYGQLTTQLSDKWSINTGLRFERRNADYSDSLNIIRNNDESLWGGRIALERELTNGGLLYALVSRGYKAGGVNGQIISAVIDNSFISESNFDFFTESLVNIELGLKRNWFDNRLQVQAAAFYQDRNDAQIKQSIFNPDDFSFDDFLANADAGSAVGIEIEFGFIATDNLDVYGSLGLIDAEFDAFLTDAHVDARDDINGIQLESVNLEGRDLAHAPNYQFLLGGEYRFADNFFAGIEIEGKDEFFFSNSHDETSQAYELINARLGYRSENWDITLWGRNLTDEDVEVRGFFFSNAFGNNPGNGYSPETYTQLGEPRIFGVTGSYQF